MNRQKGEGNIFLGVFKIIFILFILLIQLWLLYLIYNGAYGLKVYTSTLFNVVKIIAIIYLIYKPSNPSYKITWIIVIALLPILGIICYIFWGNSTSTKKLQKLRKQQNIESIKYLPKNNILMDSIKNMDTSKYRQVEYLSKTTMLPVYNNDTVEYLKIGEVYFKRMLEDLKNAEKFIFLEYFIISKSKMWDEIIEILKQKSDNGVKVYIITDEFGSLFRLPKEYKNSFDNTNIKTKVFNPIIPIISSHFNYRDHRKITVIDGKIAYTGGINIGDEYINKINRLGHWKDFGIRITGESVNSFSFIFLKMWNIINYKDNIDYKEFITIKNIEPKGCGYVLPFSDDPSNSDNPGEFTYINMINSAKSYVYITTPYLIIDNEMLKALTVASKSGIDVRIVLPKIPDKKLVFALSRSYYEELLESGVKIYEYAPGFIHGKSCVVDDEVAVVGTINFDFRSFYLHYECATWMYNTGTEIIIKNDFLDTINKSIEINLDDWKKRSLLKKILEAILRVFGPLL